MANTSDIGGSHSMENPPLLDPATGALSRTAFLLRLEELSALATRVGHGLSVVLIDLAAPAALQSRYGEDAVDVILAQMVDRIWDRARRSDAAARVGPARLAVILPATHRDGADIYAARLLPELGGPAYQVEGHEVRVRVLVKAIGTTIGVSVPSEVEAIVVAATIPEKIGA